MRISRVTIALALLPLLACASAQETPDAPATDEVKEAPPAEPEAPVGQLPTTVTPLAYDLMLDIRPGAGDRFSGRVDIRVKLDEATDLIWMHSQGHEITKASVGDVAAKLEQKTESGVAAFTLEEAVGPGEVTLHVEYTAPFDTQLKGLYKVSEGEHAYAFTQFESHFARLCFPGFDEPRFKTPYTITVRKAADERVVTTTSEASRKKLEDGADEVVFHKTRPLPTYLLAFAVGPLDIVEHEGGLPANSVRKEPLAFRGVAAKGKGERLKFAMAKTEPILRALEEYFAEPYPFEKLDIIAVPDFSSGAMENVGAVTFREWLLLVDEKSAPISQKQAFTSVMAHELAHMWFGNKVTMPWWDDIWLNEAFATWMANRTIETVRPEWAKTGLMERVHGAMGNDSLTSARQIRQPIESDHDIRNAFDSITYSKGGGVLAMVERWLGAEVFRDGLRAYMEKHAYGSATYEDLLAALSHTAKKDVATPFKTFLFQPGVPFIDVKSSCEGDKTKLALSQSRYFSLGSKGDTKASWQVPMCFSYGVGKKTQESCTLVLDEKAEHVLDGGKCAEWVMPNAAGAGYYRFGLDAAELDKVPYAKLPVRERLAFLDAVRSSFAAGRLDAAGYYPRLSAFAKDSARAIALKPIGSLSHARDILVSPEHGEKVEAFGRKIYAPVMKKLGYATKKGEDADVTKLRASVFSYLALEAKHEATNKRAVTIGKNHLAGKKVDPELVGAGLLAHVRGGDEKLWDEVHGRLAKTDDALERNRIIGALSGVLDEARAKKALGLVLSGELRGNEMMTPLWRLMGRPETRGVAWSWLQENWDKLTTELPTTRQGGLPWLASSFCSQEKLDEARVFFTGRIKDVIGGPRNLKGSLEAVELCTAAVAHHRPGADAYFGGSVASR
jgi:alanyl aminopeptidase